MQTNFWITVMMKTSYGFERTPSLEDLNAAQTKDHLNLVKLSLFSRINLKKSDDIYMNRTIRLLSRTCQAENIVFIQTVPR